MRKHCKIMLLLAALLALCLAGCGVNITSVGLPTEQEVIKGETLQLAVSYGVEDEATEEKIAQAAEKLALEWTSSDEAVVTVDETGLVTAVAAGQADVTVSVKDGNLSSTCRVTVTVPLERMEVAESLSLIINLEESAPLAVTLYPADATDVALVYESSDESVATVDADGTVHAVGNGECAVTARAVSANGPGETKETETVVKVDVAPISISLEDATLTIGYTGSLEVAVEGDGLTVGETFTWASSDSAIVEVDENGGIKGVALGSATVTVSNEIGQSATCTVTVKNIVCAYCGAEGHGSGNCPVKAADEAEAARQAAAAAAQAAAAASGGGGSSGYENNGQGGGTSGGSGTIEIVPGGNQTIMGGGVMDGPNENGSVVPNL
ncbi:MAG: Ig-like domain-containing protein [Muribaculaceae bacterium]|nr:Ig-like domain-containing protein [Muribaculaceae bacterium]